MREVLEYLENKAFGTYGITVRQTLERWMGMIWKCEDQCERYVDSPTDNCDNKVCWLYEMKIEADKLKEEIEEVLK